MRLCLLIMIYLMGSVSALNAQDFATNPDAVILMFDMRGGQKPRTADGPVLQMCADGTVTARALKPGDPAVTMHLSREEQITFFRELVDDTGILDMTTASIEDEIAMQNIQIRRFPDAPVTFLSIYLPKGSTSIRIKGVSALAYLAPEVESLQKLFSIQRRLLNFAKQVNAEAG